MILQFFVVCVVICKGLPGVLSVKPDSDINSAKKDYSTSNFEDVSVSKLPYQRTLLFPKGSKNWLVRVKKPSSRFLSKAQAVDSYVNILTKVLRKYVLDSSFICSLMCF